MDDATIGSLCGLRLQKTIAFLKERMKKAIGQLQKRFGTRALALCLFSLGACSTIENIGKPAPTFNLADHAQYLQSGLAEIKGTVAVGSGAKPQSCAGGLVYLLPDTPFFEAKVGSAGSGDSPEDLGLQDDKLDHVVRRAQCDIAGQFVFDGLPEGHWVVLTTLSLPKGATGPALVSRVVTQPGLTIQITLNDTNLLKK
jgi:hypothetical protein